MSTLRARLAGSTPLHLTGLLILVFAGALLMSFSFVYWLTRNNIETILQEQLRHSMSVYRAIGSRDALRARIVSDAAGADPKNMVVLFLSDRGEWISNVAFFPQVSGFAIVDASAVAGKGLADSYLALGGRVGDGQLILAESREQVLEMGDVFLTVFVVSLLPTLLIASGVGLFVAVRVRRKIDSIQSVLHDLTGGKLDARVPVRAGDAEDLSRIGAAVNLMATAQEASIASLRQVSSDIAHDLRTPIQRVAVLLERLADKTGLSPEQRAIVDGARDETDRIVKTFQALLQIAQIEGGAVRERFVPVRLDKVAATIVDIFGPAAEEAGLQLDLKIEAGEPFIVKGDRHLLGQVLANLIENGLRHVPAGGHIEVALERRSAGIVLAVRDDGPGVPAEERENVLRRLYRLERSRTTEGSGLGLSTVAAICTLHAARLELGDNGPGLAVTVTFPA